MHSILRGLFAGLAAGAILAVLYFVDYGPGNSLALVAHWFGISGRDSSRWLGFVLLIILGGVFGIILGVLQRNREVTFSRSLVTGLVLGFVWWAICPLFLGLLIAHAQLNLGTFLFSFVTSLMYGLLLGTIYFQSAMS